MCRKLFFLLLLVVVGNICGRIIHPLDVNCDGDVNMGDVIALLYYVGYGVDVCNPTDVNQDGRINMGDVIALLYEVGFSDLSF